jgi:hypothetical protein
MTKDVEEQGRVLRWDLPASLVLHLLIAALLVFGLPVSLSRPQEEQAIKVDLVPPPKPSEKAKIKPSPPAKESKPQKSQEANVKPPSPASNDAARHGLVPVVKPVFQYGEKDAGPRESLNGNSAEDGSASPAAPPNLDKQDPAAPPIVTAVEAINQVPRPGAAGIPAAKPADAAKMQETVKLQDVKRLFSRAATDDPIAMTAMAGVPRGERARRLCSSELGEQLLHASPPYFPESLPSRRLNHGTIIEVPGAYFRANGQWYNVSFRCEVDTDATKVVSFAFHVGDPLPRSEWERRGLPSQ